MTSLLRKLLPLLLAMLPVLASAAPLTIDVTTPVPPPGPSPYGPGTTKNPQGDEITADTRSFFLDGKPWIPIAGEFHYSRYPRDEWRDELLKMKAGGITVVSTYVFWIHQEEEQGKFDWTGQRSLHDFLQLCKDVGLKAFVRMGPWCHGEVRNGGFPDWVENSGTKLRSTDPAFLALVKPFFAEQAKQMQGLLWKDGGPVIGVQVDNECGDVPYLLALRQMARDAGVDVPYYASTGWPGPIPEKDLIPLFGSYADGFWGGDADHYRAAFFFTPDRAHTDLGAPLPDNGAHAPSANIPFPYACVEIGPGMMSSYAKRIKISPSAVAAMALTKLGSGNNMPGYYMYHGGINPDGKLSTLEETHPNAMPVKDYDFQTAIGACGQVRDQLHLLLQQHLFLEDFGPALARMPAFFPDKKPAGVKDFDTLRWAVRSDGTTSFLFFSNEQPYLPLPEHKEVQFQLKTAAGPLLVPARPVTIPPGAFGIWPVNLDCDGVPLNYATAQPLCRIDDKGNPTYFFAALHGIVPELCFTSGSNQFAADKTVVASGTDIRTFQLPTGGAVHITKPAGGTVTFFVLNTGQSRRVWRANFAGQDRLILSNAALLTDGTGIRLESDNVDDLAMSVFPPVPFLKIAGTGVKARPEGIFSRFSLDTLRQPDGLFVGVTQEHPAGPAATSLKGDDEATWKDAAVYKLDIPPEAADRHFTLYIHYIGDAARLYIGNKLYDDNFYNGDPFAIPLWRIAPGQWPALRLKVLPYSDALATRLPGSAKKAAAAAKAASTLDQITVTASEQLELRVTPN